MLKANRLESVMMSYNKKDKNLIHFILLQGSFAENLQFLLEALKSGKLAFSDFRC